MNDFLKELKALLEKYDAAILFNCCECFDNEDVYDGIVIEVGNERKGFSNWSLLPGDIDE